MKCGAMALAAAALVWAAGFAVQPAPCPAAGRLAPVECETRCRLDALLDDGALLVLLDGSHGLPEGWVRLEKDEAAGCYRLTSSRGECRADPLAVWGSFTRAGRQARG